MRTYFSILLLLCLIWNLPVCVGQANSQVVTMRSGIQYVGQVAGIPEYGSEQLNPWNSKQIVLVNDGLRRIFFNIKSAGNLAEIDDANPRANPTEFLISQKTFGGTAEGYGNVRYSTFNEFGHRSIQVATKDGLQNYIQGITRLTPFWCELQTLNSDSSRPRRWTMRVDTNSISPAVIRNLLQSQIKDRENPADYLTIIDFFRESQQYKTALDELAVVSNRFPDLDAIIEDQQVVIRQARASQWVRQVNDRIRVGQRNLGSEMLRAFDRNGVAGEILAEMASIQSDLKQADERVKVAGGRAIKFINDCTGVGSIPELTDENIEMLNEFVQLLSDELNVNNYERLDAFNQLSNDDQLSKLQKLALAISGWYLGSNNATDNFATAQCFPKVHELVVQYLVSDSPAQRAEILSEFEKYEGGEPKYLASLLANMKPPNVEKDAKISNDQPMSFEVSVPNPKKELPDLIFKYQVQLPGEYDPYRKYPCIVALPGDKNIDRELLIWCGPPNRKLGIRVGQASRNGYIVVAVDWKTNDQFEYGYTAREHATVLNSLRDALTRFAIDTDRVFLAGHGFGGDAALDIGIAHPDHWAGVISISGQVARYPDLYRDHKHNRLPIYCVVGQKDLEAIRNSQDAWNKWLRSGNYFETTLVEYIGRPKELFVEEIIEIFKWANGLKRRLPSSTGFKIYADIRRPWDNYFWFAEIHGIPFDRVVWPQFYGKRHPNPIEMEVELREGQSNRFVIRKPSNAGDGLSLWLSPELVDFNREIVVSGRGSFSEFVRPNREVLLEDARLRCDRQHPYWANIVCEGKRWKANQPSVFQFR